MHRVGKLFEPNLLVLSISIVGFIIFIHSHKIFQSVPGVNRIGNHFNSDAQKYETNFYFEIETNI
jgi:hypothetical protein